MKLECDIVRDLMDMYAEGMCSEASVRAVESHLSECEECRVQLERLKGVQTEEIACEINSEDISVARSFRKLRRRWMRSVVAALLALPILILAINQHMGQGICFTNMDEILLSWRYIHAVEAGDFEKAAGYMDYDRIYGEIQDALSWKLEDYGPIPENEAQRQYDFNRKYYAKAQDMAIEEFEAFMRDNYASNLQALAARGVTFKCIGFRCSYYIEENDLWVTEWSMRAVKDEVEYLCSIHVGVSDGEITISSMRHPDDKMWLQEIADAIFMSWPGEK